MHQRKPAAPRPPSQRRARGVATVSSHAGTPSPKLPHERDESTGDTVSGPRKRIRQAHDDIERGLQDTDRGPVTDQTYRKLKK